MPGYLGVVWWTMFPLLVGSGLAGKAGVDMCENQDRIKMTHPPQNIEYARWRASFKLSFLIWVDWT